MLDDTYFLQYEGKKTHSDVLKNTKKTKLHLLRDFHDDLNAHDNHNMLIFGENASVLNTLQKTFEQKISLVYTDPPFSTNQIFKSGSDRTSTISHSNSDSVAYNDQLVGCDYFEFLRTRLIFLKELLSDHGSIYVHMDTKKGHYVKILLDEIFGENYFINHISRVKSNPKNFKRSAYGNIHDMILFYSKSKNHIWNNSVEEYSKEDIIRLFNKIDEKGRRFTTNPLHAPNETTNGETGKLWKHLSPPKGRHWRYSIKKLDELEESGLIEWSSKGNPRKIIYAEDFIKKKKKRQDIWTFKDKPNPSYPTEKNLDMLQEIICASSNPNDYVLDCFSGGGSTLLASQIQGRKWIGIDRSPVAIETTITKLLSQKDVKPFSLYVSEEYLNKLPQTLQKLIK